QDSGANIAIRMPSIGSITATHLHPNTHHRQRIHRFMAFNVNSVSSAAIAESEALLVLATPLLKRRHTRAMLATAVLLRGETCLWASISSARNLTWRRASGPS